MSYHLNDPRLLPPPSAIHRPITYPLPPLTYPLSQVETDAAALAREQGVTVGKVLLTLVVIAVIVLLLKKLSEDSKDSAAAPVRNPVNRLSTAALAKKLYERVDERGNANPALLRSLAAYARTAK